MKIVVGEVATVSNSLYAAVNLVDALGTTIIGGAIPCSIASGSTADIQAGIASSAIAWAAGLGYTLSTSDIILGLAVPGPTPSYTFNPSRSLVTGTGATGFQISATQNVWVTYSATIVTTATITGNASGTVVLEVAPTNSATPSDWKEVGRLTNGQALSLAVTLQSVQTTAGSLSGMIPAGYFLKLRTINNTGTPTFALNSGEEVVLF